MGRHDLAICKELVDLMGGSIGVDSREGEGASFWFQVRLEVADPFELRPVPAAMAPLADSAVVSILLVEDVVINQDLAKAVLERWGHKVDIAANGAIAIEMIHVNNHDLVLMDVQMPVMDGITATQIIRNSKVNATVPIIAMTANVLPQQIAALIEAGMNDHVGKPFKAAGLKAAIGRWTTERARHAS